MLGESHKLVNGKTELVGGDFEQFLWGMYKETIIICLAGPKNPKSPMSNKNGPVYLIHPEEEGGGFLSIWAPGPSAR